MPQIDLHIHTSLSDGTLSPEMVTKLACTSNCQMIAITDHEVVESHQDLKEKYDIDIISGIEFNSSMPNLHLLGYGIEDCKLINTEMRELREQNDEVCRELINLMQKAGYDISISALENYLDKKTDYLDKRKIVKYLIDKGYVSDTIDAYKKLIGKHCEFYIPSFKLSPKEIISLVTRSGGIIVVAHPNTLTIPINKQYELFKDLGVSGIEVVNKKMKCDNDIYAKMAEDLKLIKTVGSDFHDPNVDNIGLTVDDKTYEAFKEELAYKKIRRRNALWH